MILKELLAEIETSTHPVAKALYKSESCKLLFIAFKKGMILKEHKTNLPSKLIVLSGSIIYKQGDITKHLTSYEDTDIPEQIIHSVTCTDDALCILRQG